MLAVAFGIAIGISVLFNLEREAPGVLIGGVILVAIELSYRLKKSDGDYDTPMVGGSLFFIPAWVMGALWVLL